MNSQELWSITNKNLIAKSIGELAYEQLLKPIVDSKEGGCSCEHYRIGLKSGVTYRFQAWRGIWDHLRVAPNSVERFQADKKSAAQDAGQFFIDAQLDLEMTDIVLGNFLEEMQSTLYSDMKILEKNLCVTAKKLTALNGNDLQSILNGHPKILLNKGRLGWGASDLTLYAPECAKPFQLHWIAVLKEKTIFGLQKGTQMVEFYEGSLSHSDIQEFKNIFQSQNKTIDDYFFIPTHPWQWDRIIQIQFVGEVARGEIISLGLAGDFYRPQISIRTLSNISRPEKPDIKLPLTILNTSAIRGIPARYISSSPDVAVAVSQICKTDPVLLAAGTEVLEERAGVSFQHPTYAQVKGAPYRYQETLGVIWRESVQSKLASNEIGVIVGCLFYQDLEGKSLIGAYIERSGLEVKQWLQRYFDSVVIPLYHLQLKYGLGLVAHGQNITLKLRNFAPHGMLLKDFQGDLRISNEFSKDRPIGDALTTLDKLPPEYLIHDLITGHFLTVLRFVSEVLQESEGFPENEFYQILSESICRYLDKYPNRETDSKLSLLNKKIHRVLLNKVRFKIGYADSSQRPLPMLGTDLVNPLASGGQNG